MEEGGCGGISVAPSLCNSQPLVRADRQLILPCLSCRSPTNPERLVTKRIIALPGDVVHTKARYPRDTVMVPAGHVWVEGDHPDSNKNHDSNWYGPVSQSLIVGRVGAVVWPWRRRGSVETEWRGSKRVVEAREGEEKRAQVYRL